MEFVELLDKLEENEICWDLPACCDPAKSSYSLLRFQAQGNIFFSHEGVWIESREHEEKCLSLLQHAKQKNYDLVLFPEYCLSYSLLERVTRDTSLWPENRKLWVLPCQGIPCDEFFAFLEQVKALPDILLLRTAADTRNVQKSQFITALFYCFIAYRGDKPVLCLVPQLKTHPMADSECHCEQPGMSTGDIIFTLNKRLVTLLCADSLNNQISWQSFQQNGMTDGFIILHPQLNRKPKDADFSRLRREMFSHGQPAMYISCNWAAGTSLSPKAEENAGGNSRVGIKQSWSCVYRKHGDDCFVRWKEKDTLRADNEKHSLYGAFMKSERTEVWFSPYHEHALHVMMPNLTSNGYGKIQLPDIRAMEQLLYCPSKSAWEPVSMPKSTLQQRIDNISPPNKELSEFSSKIEAPYRFPLDADVSRDADRFFSLALARFHKSALEIDRDENLAAWTLLIDKSDTDTALKALSDFWHLINILIDREALPSHCVQLREDHEFCYRPAHGRFPGTNIRTEHCEMTVAYATDAITARRHAEFLKDNECSKDEDLYREFVRVFYQDPLSDKLCCVPRVSADITRGSGIRDEGDIADGEG